MLRNYISKVIKCKILPITTADHAPVIIELDLNREQGETVWRLSNSLLRYEHFKEKIQHSIKYYLEINGNGEVRFTTLWEAAKATLQGEIIAYKRDEEKDKR